MAIGVKDGDQKKIVIYTIKKVQAHEELTFNYTFKADKKQQLECRCGKENCQGRFN